LPWLRLERGERRPPLHVLVEEVQELIDLTAVEGAVGRRPDALGLRHRSEYPIPRRKALYRLFALGE